MKRMLFSAAAAATLCGAGFVAGKNCHPKAEGPLPVEACQISTAGDDSARLIELLAKRAIRQSAPILRQELGAGAEGEAEIKYTLFVNEQGRLRIVNSLARCQGRECPGESELPEMIGILLASDWALGPQKIPCFFEIGVKVPALSKEGDSPLILLPRGEKGIEL